MIWSLTENVMMDGCLDSTSWIVYLDDGDDDDSKNDDGDAVNTSKMLHTVRVVRVTLTRTYSFYRVEQRSKVLKLSIPNSKVILLFLVNKSQMFICYILRSYICICICVCMYTHTHTHTHVYILNMYIQEEPGGLQSMGSQRVGHDLVTEPQQQ